MRVLDLGGTVEMWMKVTPRPREVVVLNEYHQEPAAEWTRPVVGDACSLPPDLLRERFDLVYSNSVIEHVGGFARREAFAKSVHKMADAHWVQTPNRYFPIEPHWVFPGFQFLPLNAKVWVARHWPLTRAFDPSKPSRATMHEVLSVDLLTVRDMRFHFPNSQILIERFGGIAKSVIAVKGH